MSLRKMLGLILLVVVFMFSLMLATSYAWYSFNNASTEFEVVTGNDDIMINYLRGEYIATNVAVPILSKDIDRYSEKNNFSVQVKNNVRDNDIVVTVSLVDIDIDYSLRIKNFRIDLYYQDALVASTTGDYLTEKTINLADITIDGDVENNFELRVYLLDDGTDQSLLMNKSFKARIGLNVVSRLKTTFTKFKDPDIFINNITIDGKKSNSLPTSGYYKMKYSCDKGSTLKWSPLSKTITYSGNIFINDSCNLDFTSDKSTVKLSDMKPGSYVKYTGNNGCDGKHCSGDNGNYLSDDDMGYCGDKANKFTTNGFRIAYVKDSTAYLVSAGSPECVQSYAVNESTDKITLVNGAPYYFAKDYIFNKDTGEFSLNGVGIGTFVINKDYKKIKDNYLYTCMSANSTTCDTLYKVIDANNKGGTYQVIYNTYKSNDIKILDKLAIKYCNKSYAYGDKCNSDSTWNINSEDYKMILDSELADCIGKKSDKECGYGNDLIFNGGIYNFSYLDDDKIGQSSYNSIDKVKSIGGFGIRPVIRLKSNIVVVSGSGSYEDPYVISNK